jgi:hypothetical protein
MDPSAASTDHHIGTLESTTILQNVHTHVPVNMSTIPEHSNLQKDGYENLKMILLRCILIFSSLLTL